MYNWFSELAIASSLIALLFAAFVAGRRMGRVSEAEQEHLGVIQGASLGVLGLLIGFSFSGAMGRFSDRRAIIVEEANAISTAWLRADLLAEPHRADIKALLNQYTEARLVLFAARDSQAADSAETSVQAVQNELWGVACVAVGDSESLREMVLPPLNQAFDARSSRNESSRSHIPGAVIVVLLLSAMLSTAMISYGQASRGQPVLYPAVGLVVLIGIVIWITIDLDFPRSGLVQVNDAPFRELLKQQDVEQGGSRP